MKTSFVPPWVCRQLTLFCVAAAVWLAEGRSAAQTMPPSAGAVSPPPFRRDQILVQPKLGLGPAALAQFHLAANAEVLGTFPGLGGLQIVRVPRDETVERLLARYQRSGLFEFAEPDYLLHANLTPDDPKYLDGTLWGLNNTGQNGGTPDADIDAPEGWDVLSSASNIVVTVLDTGIRFTHEDLASNLWVNPNDGGHGLNAFTGTNNATDDQSHGTLMAGVLGAAGNNGKGVTGVAWRVQLMAGKCLDSSGSGSDSTLIACIDYARTNGARIISASLDGPGFSLAVSNAIYAAREAGIIYVASAGNNNPGLNIDVTPRYPSGYVIDNIVSVAYTTRTDALGFLSNFGATNVDLAAPGDKILSTYYTSDTAYYPTFDFINLAGTSYAAAYVSGALALMLAKFPAETHQQIISRLLAATDPLPSLAGKCVSGGRLNLRKALSPPILLTPLAASLPFASRVAAGPNRSCVVEVSTNLTSWMPLVTNTTSPAGTFDFTDPESTTASPRFYRATAAP